MTTSSLARILVALLMVLVLAACSSDDDDSGTTNPTDPGGGDDPSQVESGFSGSLPNGAGYDYEINADVAGPPGAGLTDGGTAWGRIAEGSRALDAHLEGENTQCSGHSFAYECNSDMDFTSTSVYVRNVTQAEGNGTDHVDNYRSWGMAIYDIYFEVDSSDDTTTEVEVTVPFSITGLLSYSFGSDDETDYVDAVASCSLTARVYETDVWDGEIGPEFGLTDRIGEIQGAVSCGYDDSVADGAGTGFLAGQINDSATQNSFTGSSSITVSVIPGQIYCLRYTVSSSTRVNFYGMYGFEAHGHALSEATASVSLPAAGIDPDNPEAEIGVTIHRAESR